MHAEQTTCASQRRRQLIDRTRYGFTLVELMIVVVIIGILSAVAIPSFQSYLMKARTAEATEFLGIIKLREESYRSEFGSYCKTVSGDNGDGVADLGTLANLMPNPTNIGATSAAFTSSNSYASNGFRDLGARPGGTVRFGYGVAAGTPAALPASSFGWTAANADFWYIARAVADFWYVAPPVADLDRDGTFITFETYSASKNIWIGVGNATEAKGWE